jgi:hypothetical protein
VHINRALRQAGWLKVRLELGREQLDAGASDAFAVADHQIAHVYVARPELIPRWPRASPRCPAWRRCWTRGQARVRPRSPAIGRAGRDFAKADSWFTYYHFLDDAQGAGFRAHRRDPQEAGLRPGRAVLRSQDRLPEVAQWRRDLAQKVLGMRYLMDVIGLDATVVRGSHGRPTDRAKTVRSSSRRRRICSRTARCRPQP